MDTIAAQLSVLRMDFTSFCMQQLTELNLSRSLLYFILYIGKHPGCCSSEISSALKLDAAQVTRSLDRLVSNGLIQKQKSSSDKRTTFLFLTSNGEQAFQKSHLLVQEWEKQLLSDLSDQETELLRSCLKKLCSRTSLYQKNSTNR